MSDNVGLYLDGDWYTEIPKRRTLRMVQPTKWQYRIQRLLVFVGLCVGLVYLNIWDTHRIWAHYNYPPPYRLTSSDLNISMGLVTASLLLAVFYAMFFFLFRPVLKLQHRDKLIEKGKLFPQNHPVVQMLFTPEVVFALGENSRSRESTSKAVNEFAAGMFAAQKKFNDERWYLNAGAEQQTAWRRVMSLEGGSPLDQLGNITWKQRRLLDNIDCVIREQAKLRKAELALQLGAAQEKATEQKTAWEKSSRRIAELQTQIQFLNTQQVVPAT